ncbi:MAG: hypothetical protein QOC70_1026 [Verrucomicrobiota bacterium]|jgi:hypothetical protein
MDLHERIEAHPGMPYFRALLGYEHSKNVLSGNAFELKRFIEVLESQELEQKVGYEGFRKGFRDFDGHLVRYVHNFLAGVMTLVSHTRVLMRSPIISPAHRTRYQAKIGEHFAESTLAKFMQGFRNYFLHYGVPATIHQTTILPKEFCEILIDMDQLRPWPGWTSDAKAFIDAHRPTMRLLTLVSDYERLAVEFHTWFILDFAREYSATLTELESLQREWNERLKA